MTAGEDGLPGKARENLDVVRRFEDDPQNEASAAQRAIERASRLFGSPACFVGAVAFAACGIAVHTLGRAAGWPRREDLPFFWLQGLVSLDALLLTIAVLIRQNRMSDVADPCAHLDLQANLPTGQTLAKILEIIACLHASPACRRRADPGRMAWMR